MGWTAIGAVAAPVVWGSTYLVTTELLPPGRPLLDGALRALPAGLLLLAIGRTLPAGSWWWRSVVLGALNIAIFFALLFVAAERMPGGVAATLIALQPLAVGVLAVPLLGVPLLPRRVVAGVAGVGGVALLVLQGDARVDPLGVAAALGAAASMSVGVILVQRWGRPGALLPFAAWQLTAGGLLLVPFALAFEGLPATLSTGNAAGFAYLTLIGAAVTYPLWFRTIRRVSAPVASFLGLFSPVTATVLGVIAAGEGLTAWQAAGLAITLASIAAAQVSPVALFSRLRSQRSSTCPEPS
jgi:probable blue pigment (indigoidine) exporter